MAEQADAAADTTPDRSGWRSRGKAGWGRRDRSGSAGAEGRQAEEDVVDRSARLGGAAPLTERRPVVTSRRLPKHICSLWSMFSVSVFLTLEMLSLFCYLL